MIGRIHLKPLIYWESPSYFGKMLVKKMVNRAESCYIIYSYDLEDPKHRVEESSSFYFGKALQSFFDTCDRDNHHFTMDNVFEGKPTARLKESVYPERVTNE